MGIKIVSVSGAFIVPLTSNENIHNNIIAIFYDLTLANVNPSKIVQLLFYLFIKLLDDKKLEPLLYLNHNDRSGLGSDDDSGTVSGCIDTRRPRRDALRPDSPMCDRVPPDKKSRHCYQGLILLNY